MTKNEEYVNYALKNLEESLREALESEATPKEVYDAIVIEVEEDLRKRHRHPMLVHCLL